MVKLFSSRGVSSIFSKDKRGRSDVDRRDERHSGVTLLSPQTKRPPTINAESLVFTGAPGKIRTCDPLIRSQILYPTELQALKTMQYYISKF